MKEAQKLALSYTIIRLLISELNNEKNPSDILILPVILGCSFKIRVGMPKYRVCLGPKPYNGRWSGNEPAGKRYINGFRWTKVT